MIKRLIAVLLIWQLVVMLLAVVAYPFRRGERLQPPSFDDYPSLAPLLKPNATDRGDLLEQIAHRRVLHERGMRRAMEVVERKRQDPKGRAEPTSGQESIAGWPRSYVSYSYITLVSTLPEMYGLEAAGLGDTSDRTLSDLDSLSQIERSHDDSMIDQIRYARLLVYLGRGQYVKAVDFTPKYRYAYRGMPRPVLAAVKALIASPDLFRNRMRLVQSLRSYELTRAKAAHEELVWRAYEVATTDQERLEALLALPSRDPELLTICAGLACRDPALVNAWATSLAGLADSAARFNDEAKALVLYSIVADRMPGTNSWGVSVFNRAYLLQAAGQPGAAVQAALPMFPSKVNDLDPGSHIMEAYRNYRHRSARLIADAYRDMWNFPASWLWEWRATYAYPYRSWCGTCQWSEDRQAVWRSATSSVAAGPIVCAFNFVAAPARNWRFWLMVGIAVWVVRRVRRWRRRRAEAASA